MAGVPISDIDHEPTFEEVAAIGAVTTGLVFTDDPVPAEFLATLAPPRELDNETAQAEADQMLVVTSLRMPVGLLRRLKGRARADGVTVTDLIRRWAELYVDDDADTVVTFRRADLHRAIEQVLGFPGEAA